MKSFFQPKRKVTFYFANVLIGAILINSNLSVLNLANGSEVENNSVYSSVYNNSTVTDDVYNPLLTEVIEDLEPPTQPSNLSLLYATDSSLSFVWDISTDNVDVAGYQVFRATVDEGIFSKVGQVTTNNFEDSNLDPCTTYQYYVIAFDGSGNTSQPSECTNFTTLVDTTNPQIIEMNPPPGCKVSIGVVVTVKFDDQMKKETINDESFYLTVDTTGERVSASITYNIETRTASLIPFQPLLPDTRYRVDLKPAITNICGLPLGLTWYNFRTDYSEFESPHGNYEYRSSSCAACHSTHGSSGSKLITETTMQELCLSCHDGTGSSAIFNEFPSVRHSLDANCVTCHNPHSVL